VGEALQEPEEPPLLCLGLHWRRGMPGVWDAEKVAEQRKRIIQLFVKSERPPGDLVTHGALAVVLPDAEVIAHDL
jgi:hypothetical protein